MVYLLPLQGALTLKGLGHYVMITIVYHKISVPGLQM